MRSHSSCFPIPIPGLPPHPTLTGELARADPPSLPPSHAHLPRPRPNLLPRSCYPLSSLCLHPAGSPRHGEAGVEEPHISSPPCPAPHLKQLAGLDAGRESGWVAGSQPAHRQHQMKTRLEKKGSEGLATAQINTGSGPMPWPAPASAGCLGGEAVA